MAADEFEVRGSGVAQVGNIAVGQRIAFRYVDVISMNGLNVREPYAAGTVVAIRDGYLTVKPDVATLPEHAQPADDFDGDLDSWVLYVRPSEVLADLPREQSIEAIEEWLSS